MTIQVPDPSPRLRRAANSEREDLLRHREGLQSRRQSLIEELQELDEAIGRLEQQVAAIGVLIGDHDDRHRDDVLDRENDRADALVLRGPAIRETAVQMLISQPQYIEALHYRRWYELVQAAGYRVAGKDPLAVFLTQISKSPVVRKASEAGVYELDRQAPLRLRQRLERLRTELREVSATAPSDTEIPQVRSRRHELDVAISQHERALEEALRVLRRDDATTAQAG
jgi:hypothetical protein